MFQLPSEFRWLMPWSPISLPDKRQIEEELRREIPQGHVLADCEFEAIGESDNYDDFLFATVPSCCREWQKLIDRAGCSQCPSGTAQGA